MRLPRSVSPEALVLALDNLNTIWRSKHNTLPFPLRKLSFCVLRMAPEDAGETLLALLCHAMGVPPGRITDLMHSPTPADARRHFAEFMNTFSANKEAPAHRAPDVLILLLPATENSEKDAPSDGPLDFDAVFNEELGRLLENGRDKHWRREIGDANASIDDKRWQKVLGHTRILIVRDSPSHWRRLVPITFRGVLPKLQALSVFRYGFTQQMAAIALGRPLHAAPIRDLLQDLQRRELLQLVGAYWFMLADVRAAVADESPPAIRAERHGLAFQAFAPYLFATHRPGLLEMQAWEPWALIEAQYHAREVITFFRSHPGGATRVVEDFFPAWHNRWAEFVAWFCRPSWDAIHFAAELPVSPRREPTDWALEFVERRRSKGGKLSIREQVSLLRLLAATSRGGSDWSGDSFRTQLQCELPLTIRELTMALCGTPTRGTLKLAIICSMVAHDLVAQELGPDGLQSDLKSLDQKCIDSISNDTACLSEIPPKWFAQCARLIVDNNQKYELYVAFAKAHPFHSQSWLGALAAAQGNTVRINHVEYLLRATKRNHPHEFDLMCSWTDVNLVPTLDNEGMRGWECVRTTRI